MESKDGERLLMTTTQPTTPDTALAVHDRDAALESAGGDVQLADELMAALLAGLPEELAALETCLAEADWPGLADYAHQVRGATGYCGVPALDAAIAALERAARAEDPARCQSTFENVQRQTEALLAHCRTVGD